MTIFLSSGADLRAQRDWFDRLVNSVNEQLAIACPPNADRLHLHVQMWEHDVAKRTDGDPNKEFRRRAAEAHVTVVLLWNDLRPGTKEEITEALKEPLVQVSAIWFEPTKPKSNASKELKAFLDKRKKRFIWEPAKSPGTDESTIPMMKIIARVLADVWAQDLADDDGREGTFNEQRRLEDSEQA